MGKTFHQHEAKRKRNAAYAAHFARRDKKQKRLERHLRVVAREARLCALMGIPVNEPNPVAAKR